MLYSDHLSELNETLKIKQAGQDDSSKWGTREIRETFDFSQRTIFVAADFEISCC